MAGVAAAVLAAGACRLGGTSSPAGAGTGGAAAISAARSPGRTAGDLAEAIPAEMLSPFQRGTAGRWRPVRAGSGRGPGDGSLPGNAALAARIEELESIGYASGSRAADAGAAPSGVTVRDPARMAPGPIFWTSGHGPGAVLSGPDGRTIHEWRCTWDRAFPDHPSGERIVNEDYWRAAHLFPDGSVVAVFEGMGILRVDAGSRVLWAHANRAHHDFAVAPDGDLWVLTREAHVLPRISKSPVLEDFVAVLDPETGRERRRFSLLEAFERAGAAHDWRAAYYGFWARERTRHGSDSDPGDLFHTNSIAILDGRLEDALPAFRQGNLLLSMRNLDAVVVVDPDAERVVWSLAGAFALQHDPSVTPDGELLVFDNHWRPDEQSRVVAVDPATGETEWQYAGTPEQPLYSHSCGEATALPNGNVLVVESDNGRALEVTRTGDVVWEFWNPHRAGDRDEYIASIFRMERIRPDFPLGWTGGDRGPGSPPATSGRT